MTNFKEVNFEGYCERCTYKDRTEKQTPCCYCLEQPFIYGSIIPEKFEEAGDGNGKKGIQPY